MAVRALAFAGLLTTPPAYAEILQIDLPTAPLAIFGVAFMADHLGPHDGFVVNTTVHLEFHTSTMFGNFDAADFLLELEAPVGPGVPQYPEWQLIGPALGWSGNGVFTADLQTSALNGRILDGQGKPGSFSLWFIRLLNNAGPFPLGGQLVNSSFRIHIEPVPAPTTIAPLVVLAPMIPWRRRRLRKQRPSEE